MSPNLSQTLLHEIPLPSDAGWEIFKNSKSLEIRNNSREDPMANLRHKIIGDLYIFRSALKYATSSKRAENMSSCSQTPSGCLARSSDSQVSSSDYSSFSFPGCDQIVQDLVMLLTSDDASPAEKEIYRDVKIMCEDLERSNKSLYPLLERVSIMIIRLEKLVPYEHERSTSTSLGQNAGKTSSTPPLAPGVENTSVLHKSGKTYVIRKKPTRESMKRSPKGTQPYSAKDNISSLFH